MAQDEGSTTSPTGDVEYDPEALRKAEERIGASEGDQKGDPDPEGGHDPAALEDAAKKMGAED